MANTTPPAWVQVHRENTWKFGPLPRGIDVVASANSKEPRYSITIRNDKGPGSISLRTPEYPLSPEGRIKWHNALLKIPQPPPKDDMISIPHPPTIYRPHEWLWGESGLSTDPRPALLKALQISGLTVTINDLNDAAIRAAVDKLMTSTKEDFFHPRDRGTYPLLPEEHRVSCWARHFKRDLVIVTPEVTKDSSWGAYNNPLNTNRTEVRPRWSTGEQYLYRPIFLGCLSHGEQKLTKWFALTPTPSMERSFQKDWEEPDWDLLAQKSKYTDTEKFVFAAVSLHHALLMGAILSLKNDDLAECIVQYGNFIKNGHGSKNFGYKRPETWTAGVDKINLATLQRWILSSPEGSSAKKHAKAFDTVIEKSFAFRKNMSDFAWQDLMNAGRAAQLKK